MILRTNLCFVELIDSETVEVNIDSGDESNVSIETPEISYQEQTLPIFQKIEDLTTKVHVSILTSWLNSSVMRNETWHSFLEFYLLICALIFLPGFEKRTCSFK